MYSQQEEEKVILEFFNGYVGRLLDIGAYHPTIFSNSRRLIELGWEAVLVEASPQCYDGLVKFYKENPAKVQICGKAISTVDGKIKFYDSGGAVATASPIHYNIWKDVQKDFQEITIDSVSWETLYKEFPGIYEFINIDVEGLDWMVLKQINLNETETSLVCIEPSYNKNEIFEYLSDYGFELLHENTNNIIMVR